MGAIEDLREHRRRRLAALVKHFGQTELARLLDVSPAYLYQMSRGKGKNAKPVSDERAAAIEAAVGALPGWMDGDAPLILTTKASQPDPEAGAASQALQLAAGDPQAASLLLRIRALAPDQRAAVERLLEAFSRR